MIGDPDYRDKFEKAQDYLERAYPVDVVNPSRFDTMTHVGQDERAAQAGVDCNLILAILDPSCNDFLVLLPGWERSVGATTEKNLAHWIGLKVYEFTAWSWDRLRLVEFGEGRNNDGGKKL